MKILLIPILSCFILTSCNQESEKPVTKEEKLKDLDLRIEDTKNELISAQKKVIDYEMKSQERFRADFKGFAEEMEQVEKEDEIVKKLEKQLQNLEKEKEQIYPK